MPAADSVRQQDVRAEFALRVLQNLDFMRNQAECSCGSNGASHNSRCPVNTLTIAMEVVNNTLRHFNMSGLDEVIPN